MLWQCAKGHEWEAVAPSIKMGAWCPFCVGRGRTIKDMRELAQSRSGQCLSPIYGGTKTRLRWRCAEGHVWNSTPKNVLRGTWCPVCAGIQRLSIALMQAIAREKGGECLSEIYVNGVTKLRWRCPDGHEWDAVPDSVRHGTWCPRCAAKKRIDNRKGKTAPLTIKRMREVAARRGGECLSTAYHNYFARIPLPVTVFAGEDDMHLRKPCHPANSPGAWVRFDASRLKETASKR